jgi:hypothetical protein
LAWFVSAAEVPATGAMKHVPCQNEKTSFQSILSMLQIIGDLQGLQIYKLSQVT